MASKALGILFLFGLGFIFLGLLYRVFWDGLLMDLVSQYYITGSPGLDLVVILDHIVPTALLIMGIICVAAAGISSRKAGYV